jgi:hypothetical protein
MTAGAAEPRERFVRLAAAVRQRRKQLTQIVDEARAALADFADREPPLLELRGIGAILHDFYTGIEHVFETIAPELNGGLPAGEAWHRELLTNMTLELPGIRPPVLQDETAHALDEFLRFRHLFRNLYGYELEWSKLRALLEQLPAAWGKLESDLDRFLAFLDAAAAEG